jgi:4,5-DOPA dioxygenase extradiol
MENTDKMPAVFVGHGSPLNALEDNAFSEGWQKLQDRLPRPKAILAISAHYLTRGEFINSASKPKQIYDMYGFPAALYKIKYEPAGDPALAKEVAQSVQGRLSDSFGIDHGVWSVLRRTYPRGDIPVVEMSVDSSLTPHQMFDLGKKLSPLRKEGILLFGTGSIVHNLSTVDWEKEDGFSWAQEFQKKVNTLVQRKEYAALIDYRKIKNNQLAFQTNEHYAPLLYILGALDNEDQAEIFNDQETLGSISMTSYLFS